DVLSAQVGVVVDGPDVGGHVINRAAAPPGQNEGTKRVERCGPDEGTPPYVIHIGSSMAAEEIGARSNVGVENKENRPTFLRGPCLGIRETHGPVEAVEGKPPGVRFSILELGVDLSRRVALGQG